LTQLIRRLHCSISRHGPLFYFREFVAETGRNFQTLWKNIHDGVSFPRQEDFDSEAAYNYWRTRELGQISQHMVMMVQINPTLAKSSPSQVVPATRPESLYDRPGASRSPSLSGRQSLIIPSFEPGTVNESIQNDDEVVSSNTFTYIPPNPRKFYRHLLEVCLDYDIHAMKSLPEDQEVSLSILSSPHRAILEECALRWRVQETYCLTCHLDVIRYKEEREGLPLACVPDAVVAITKQPAEEREKWPRQDVCFVFPRLRAPFTSHLDRVSGPSIPQDFQ
jgi:hypothetical protein